MHTQCYYEILTEVTEWSEYLLHIDFLNLNKELAAVDTVAISSQVGGLVLSTSSTLHIQPEEEKIRRKLKTRTAAERFGVLAVLQNAMCINE